MNLFPKHHLGSTRPLLPLAVSMLFLAMDFGAVPAKADPASTLQTLMIVDEGNFLTLQWSFYYVDFPSKFVLKEKGGKIVSLDNPSTLYENISDIISVAFDLRIDGKPVSPDKISRLTISPNKVCRVTMIYRAHPGGRMQLRAPVLQYLPSIAMINYEILSLGHTSSVTTGNLMGHEGAFPQEIVYQEIKKADHSAPRLESAWFALFKSGLGTAWINSNWLFIIVILLLVQPPKTVGVAVLFLATAWNVICISSAVAGLKFPWTIPELILCLPTALLGVMAARHPENHVGLAFVACGAGVLNACFDLQQIRWTPEDQTSSALTGLCLGFMCSILSVVLVLVLLLGECKKFPEFQPHWAPKLCWLMAAVATIVPLQKLIFR